jgi:hypothetical protein
MLQPWQQSVLAVPSHDSPGRAQHTLPPAPPAPRRQNTFVPQQSLVAPHAPLGGLHTPHVRSALQNVVPLTAHSHPSASNPLQSTKDGAHGYEQVPAAHEGTELAIPAGHGAQEPQCETSTPFTNVSHPFV